jgi:hypothetical protein
MFCVCATRYKTTPSSITIYIIVVISTRGLTYLHVVVVHQYICIIFFRRVSV